MFERESTGVGAFLMRHSTKLLFFSVGSLLIAGVVRGLLVPGWLDFGFVAALIIYRFGLLRVTLASTGLLMLLVALTPPICGGNREKAYAAAMKSDLKNLASQQEIYYSDAYMFTTSAEELAFTHSDGVTVTIVSSGTGWAAWATHAALGEDEGCAIWWGDIDESLRTVGEVTPDQPGEIICTEL